MKRKLFDCNTFILWLNGKHALILCSIFAAGSVLMMLSMTTGSMSLVYTIYIGVTSLLVALSVGAIVRCTGCILYSPDSKFSVVVNRNISKMQANKDSELEYLNTAAFREDINDPGLYDITAKGQFMLVRNNICCTEPKVYSKQYIFKLTGANYANDILTRFDRHLFQVVYCLYVNKISIDLILKFIEILGAYNAVQLIIPGNYTPREYTLYKYKHIDKVVTSLADRGFKFTRENIKFILSGYRSYRIGKYYNVLDRIQEEQLVTEASLTPAYIARLAEQEDDVERQLANAQMREPFVRSRYAVQF